MRDESTEVSVPRILVAPDSFKGTHTATEAAVAIAAGIARSRATPLPCPAADGGEGTLGVLLDAQGGRLLEIETVDPLGRPTSAAFGLLSGGERTVAVVETATAIGLERLAADERDPWLASSEGAGILIAAAIAAGAKRVLVATGGSATVDGGCGAIEAIEASPGLIGDAELVVLCDVETPWESCAEIYGPQKGAGPELVPRLAQRLDEIAGSLPRDPRGVARTGAAGGLSGALWATYDARLESGAAYVLSASGFPGLLGVADAVVVGEGRLDRQSLEGKVVGEILGRARAAGVPAHAIVGKSELDGSEAEALGLRSVQQASTLAELTRAGQELVERWLDWPTRV